MGFLSFIHRLFDKVLIKIIFGVFIVVLVCQTLIYYQPYNLKISLVDKLEGKPIKIEEVYPAGDLALSAKNITLRVTNPYITSLPEAKILLNEKEIGDFTNLQFSLLVENKDCITIDASRYSFDLLIQLIPSEELKIKEKVIRVKAGEKGNIFIEN